METAFKPTYDPLYDRTPGTGSAYAPSYWVADAGEPPANDGALNKDVSVDVAIIGGGFTGLATALFLAREHNIKAHVLEANQVAWGCSSRNGGQGHLAWGRLSRSQWAQRWGVDMAKRIHKNTLAGFDIFQSMVGDENIDCNPKGDGNVLVAHCRSATDRLADESRFCNTILGYKTTMISRHELHELYMRDQEAAGAMVEPLGIGVQPLKLAFGYLRLARKYGARVHTGSPVSHWRTENKAHFLTTPGGIVKARVVIVATAGYTHHSLHPLLAYKNMPIMANSAVTDTLSSQQIKDCGFNSPIFLTDSRRLRFYYRYLPEEKRLQIGTRSAITGKDNDNPRHLNIIREAIRRKFPALAGIKIDYFWSGWMDISHDMMPRIVQPDKNQSIYYAQGYSGNGVSFSAYAAFNLARLVAGKKVDDADLPIFTSPLPGHPLRPLRRTGQRLLFLYFSLADRLL